MAIAAVDAEAADVVLVAERDGLRFADASISNVGGALNLHRDPTQGGNNEHRAKDGGPGQGIRTAMEDLRHSLVDLA